MAGSDIEIANNPIGKVVELCGTTDKGKVLTFEGRCHALMVSENVHEPTEPLHWSVFVKSENDPGNWYGLDQWKITATK